MKDKKIKMMLMLSCLMAFVMGVTAFAAAPVIDMDKTGSITITMNDSAGKPVGGGQMMICKAADVATDSEGYTFEMSGQFAKIPYSTNWADLAQDLADYAAANDITGETKEINASGVVSFDGLYPGLYLLIQTVPAEGYYAANPFVVSLPTYDDEAYIYEVDASPKTEVFPNPVKDVDVDTSDDRIYGDDGVQVSVGQVLTYRITYSNNRAVPASVTVTDTLDSHVEYVEGSAVPGDEGVFTYSERTLTWIIPDVPAGSSGEVTFQVKVLSSARTPKEVVNDALVQVADDSAVSTNTVRNPVPTTSGSHSSSGGSSKVNGGSDSGPGVENDTIEDVIEEIEEAHDTISDAVTPTGDDSMVLPAVLALVFLGAILVCVLRRRTVR